MTTLPAAMVAPRSPTNLVMKAFSLSSLIAMPATVPPGVAAPLQPGCNGGGEGGAMRAREPDAEGYVNHDGVKVGYAVYGSGPETVLLAPGWLVVDSRIWKLQVAYLSRYFRVITVDPRGN